MASINIVRSSISLEHGPIEMNIYETTFLLQDLLVGGERDSKNINMVSEMTGCLDYDGGGSTLNILWKDWKKKKPNLLVREYWKSYIDQTRSN